jgi:hypothetical protein
MYVAVWIVWLVYRVDRLHLGSHVEMGRLDSFSKPGLTSVSSTLVVMILTVPEE